jgi:hypothetical protein
MKVRLGNSGSGLDRIAFVYRQGSEGPYGEWQPVIRFRAPGMAGMPVGEFEINDDATKREIAAATLAVACEGIELTQERTGD